MPVWTTVHPRAPQEKALSLAEKGFVKMLGSFVKAHIVPSYGDGSFRVLWLGSRKDKSSLGLIAHCTIPKSQFTDECSLLAAADAAISHSLCEALKKSKELAKQHRVRMLDEEIRVTALETLLEPHELEDRK